MLLNPAEVNKKKNKILEKVLKKFFFKKSDPVFHIFFFFGPLQNKCVTVKGGGCYVAVNHL